MKNAIIALVLAYMAIACGGSPGPTVAGPDTLTGGDDAGQTAVDQDAGTSGQDAGATVLGDAGRAGEDAGDAGNVDQGKDAGDAGLVVSDPVDAGTDADSANPADGTNSVQNDAGKTMCCAMLPTYNAAGFATGTLPPQACTYDLSSHPLVTSDPLGSVYCTAYDVGTGGAVCEQLDSVSGNVRGVAGTLEVCP